MKKDSHQTTPAEQMIGRGQTKRAQDYYIGENQGRIQRESQDRHRKKYIQDIKRIWICGGTKQRIHDTPSHEAGASESMTGVDSNLGEG